MSLYKLSVPLIFLTFYFEIMIDSQEMAKSTEPHAAPPPAGTSFAVAAQFQDRDTGSGVQLLACFHHPLKR